MGRRPRVACMVIAVACVAAAFGVVVPGRNVGAAGGLATVGAGAAVVIPGPQFDPTEASVQAVACWAPGECVAGGFAVVPSGVREALLVRMAGRVWGAATAVPFATPPFEVPELVEWIACPAAGECVAGGGSPAFVVRMTGGAWGPATLLDIPGAPLVRSTLWAGACPAVGECAAGGFFEDPAGGFRAFTVAMTGGVLGTPEPMTYLGSIEPAPAPDAAAEIDAVTCWMAGECLAGGSVSTLAGGVRPWVARMTGGVWLSAAPVTFSVPEEVASTAPNKVSTLACWAPGECVAGGRFSPATGGTQGFLARMAGEVWQPGTPVVVPGPVADPPSGKVEWIDCPGEGECAGGGRFGPVGGGTTVYQLTMTGGVWQSPVLGAFPVAAAEPPDAAQPRGDCAGPGACLGVGFFRDAAGGTQGYVVPMVDGVWGTPVPNGYAFPVPTGAAASAATFSVGCAPSDACVAGGSAGGTTTDRRAFVLPVTLAPPSPPDPDPGPGPGPRFVG